MSDLFTIKVTLTVDETNAALRAFGAAVRDIDHDEDRPTLRGLINLFQSTLARAEAEID